MFNFNILHLLIAGGVFGAVAALRREASGRSMTAGRLFIAPSLALLTALLLLALAGPQAHTPALWIGALVAGLVAGTARAIAMSLQVDRLWDRLRLPHARDGLWASCLLGVLALAAVLGGVTSDGLAVGTVLDWAIAAATAGCAGYLAGRASTLWLRSLNAPHSTWRIL